MRCNADTSTTAYPVRDVTLQHGYDVTILSQSEAELGEVHDYNYPDVNKIKRTNSKYKYNPGDTHKEDTNDITLCHTYHSGNKSVNEYALKEDDSSYTDDYLVPNVNRARSNGDPSYYHPYDYPDPEVRGASKPQDFDHVGCNTLAWQ